MRDGCLVQLVVRLLHRSHCDKCPLDASGRRLGWGLRGQNPLSSQVSINLEPSPKAKFNRQEAQVWTPGGLRRGMCAFFPGQPCSGTAEPVWTLHGTRTWDEAAADREKAELRVREEGSVGKGGGELTSSD